MCRQFAASFCSPDNSVFNVDPGHWLKRHRRDLPLPAIVERCPVQRKISEIYTSRVEHGPQAAIVFPNRSNHHAENGQIAEACRTVSVRPCTGVKSFLTKGKDQKKA